MVIRRLAQVGIALALSCVVAGCARVVSLDPASNAIDRDCAEIMVRLPDTVDGLPRQRTDAQSTAAWGAPAEVLLRCGVPKMGPTTLRCVAIDDVDWVIDESNSEYVTATSYGRDPGTEVVINRSRTGGSAVLADLANPLKVVAAERHCT